MNVANDIISIGISIGATTAVSLIFLIFHAKHGPNHFEHWLRKVLRYTCAGSLSGTARELTDFRCVVIRCAASSPSPAVIADTIASCSAKLE